MFSATVWMTDFVDDVVPVTRPVTIAAVAPLISMATTRMAIAAPLPCFLLTYRPSAVSSPTPWRSVLGAFAASMMTILLGSIGTPAGICGRRMSAYARGAIP